MGDATTLKNFYKPGYASIDQASYNSFNDYLDNVDLRLGVNVMSTGYGATGDGSTDDSVAIQNAVTDAAEGYCFIPEPSTSFLISSPIDVSANTTVIMGGGHNFIQADSNFGDNPLFRNATRTPAADANRDTNIWLVNLRLDGNKANNSTGTQFSHCISFTSVVNSGILGGEFKDPKGDGLYLAGTTSVKPGQVWFMYPHISSPSRQGIAVIDAVGLWINSPYITGGSMHGIDLEVDNANNIIRRVHIDHPVIESCGGGNSHYGIAISCTSGAAVEDITVTEAIVNSQTGSGYGFRGVDGLHITGGQIRSPSYRGIVEITSNTSENVTVDGTQIISAGDIGAIFNNATGHTLSNLQVESAGAQGVFFASCQYCTLKGARIRGCTNAGIYVDENSDYNVFTGGIRSTGNDRGIRIMTGATNNIVTSNIFLGNTTDQLTDNGTGTVKDNNVTT